MKALKAILIFCLFLVVIDLKIPLSVTNKSDHIKVEKHETYESISYDPKSFDPEKPISSIDKTFYYDNERFEFNIAVKVFKYSHNGKEYTLLVGDTDYWKTLVTPEEKAYFKNAKENETYYIKENILGLIIYAKKQAIDWAYPSTFSEENLKEILQIEKHGLDTLYYYYL